MKWKVNNPSSTLNDGINSYSQSSIAAVWAEVCAYRPKQVCGISRCWPLSRSPLRLLLKNECIEISKHVQRIVIFLFVLWLVADDFLLKPQIQFM